MPTKKRRVTTDIRSSFRMNLACRNQRLPVLALSTQLPTGLSAAAKPRRRCSAPGTHSCAGKGVALLPAWPNQLRPTALGSHSERYRERGEQKVFLAAVPKV